MEQLKAWRLSRPDIRTLAAAGKAFGVSTVQALRYETGEQKIAPERVMSVSAITGIPPHVLRPDVFPAPKE